MSEKTTVGQLRLEDLQSLDRPFAMGPEQADAEREQRRSDRKPFPADGFLAMDGDTLDVKTVDLSTGGLSLLARRQLGVGKECQVRFEVVLEGASYPVISHAQVIYCFYTPEHDFKAGLEFRNILAGTDAIRRFVEG